MKVCGLTGGVGMGKTTTARLLGERGIGTVDTDQIARDLVQPGQPALVEIQSTFGTAILDASGRLRREELARIVFADVLARQALENILHPRIRSHWQAQIETWRSESRARAVVIIPLLFETKAESFFDVIICAACRPDTQRERLAARGWSASQIEQRMAAQMSVEQKIARSDYVLWTEGGMESLGRQVDLMLARI